MKNSVGKTAIKILYNNLPLSGFNFLIKFRPDYHYLILFITLTLSISVFVMIPQNKNFNISYILKARGKLFFIITVWDISVYIFIIKETTTRLMKQMI